MSVPKHFLSFRLLQLSSSHRSSPPRLLPPPRPGTAGELRPPGGPAPPRRARGPRALLPLGRQPPALERVSGTPTSTLSRLRGGGGRRDAPTPTVPVPPCPAGRTSTLHPSSGAFVPAKRAGSPALPRAGTRLRSTAEPGAAGTHVAGAKRHRRPQNLLPSQLLATELPCHSYSRLREASELLALQDEKKQRKCGQPNPAQDLLEAKGNLGGVTAFTALESCMKPGVGAPSPQPHRGAHSLQMLWQQSPGVLPARLPKVQGAAAHPGAAERLHRSEGTAELRVQGPRDASAQSCLW